MDFAPRPERISENFVNFPNFLDPVPQNPGFSRNAGIG